MTTITATHTQLAAAFREWDRRYREDPAGFESDMERLARGQTPEDYGDEVMPYFVELLEEQGVEDGSSPTLRWLCQYVRALEALVSSDAMDAAVLHANRASQGEVGWPYRSDGSDVLRQGDGFDMVIARCANPFAANVTAYSLNLGARAGS